MSGYDPSNPARATGSTPGQGDSGSTASTDPFAASAAASSSSSTSANEGYGAPGYGPGYVAPGYVPPPPPPGMPNTGLATLLGFIPGVGAMYNGQFAKGIAHVVIFAVLISVAEHVSNIFGLLILAWYCYMVFDAYQTARAHRDGMVPPDPFGLNNIGERLGMGKGPNWSDFTARPAPGTPNSQAYTAASAPGYSYSNGPQGTEYADANFRYSQGPQGTAYQDASSSYYNGPGGTAYQDSTGVYSAGQPGYAAGQPGYSTPFAAAGVPGAYTTAIPPLPPLAGGLPMGAIWLIGFGVFALIGTLSNRFYWSNRYLDGAIVSAIGIALLVTRTLRARGVYPSGTAAGTWYILRSSRAGLILLAIGVALTLDHAGALTWNYLWPYLLILLGVFLLVERAAHNRMLAAGPAAAGEPQYESTSSSFVPSTSPSTGPRDEEGRQL